MILMILMIRILKVELQVKIMEFQDEQLFVCEISCYFRFFINFENKEQFISFSKDTNIYLLFFNNKKLFLVFFQELNDWELISQLFKLISYIR